MNCSTHQMPGRIFPKVLAVLLLTPALVFAPAVVRAATSLQFGITPPSGANESNRTAFLTWTAEADNIYKVQSSTNLGNPAAWTTEDAVSQSTVGPLKWMAPESLQARKYYRLILPQPQIFSVEPAVFAPGVAVDVWMNGQCFQSNDVVRVDGVIAALGSVVYVSSWSLQCALPPQSAGAHLVELVRDGAVVSSFTVTCADVLTNPELVLQWPPTEPPASPSKKDFKGHVTLMKAFDDGSDGESSRTTKTGHVTLMKAFDDGSDDIQEGKKGLNAVNVKLVRMAGGEGDCDDNDPTFMAALMKAKEKANRTKCGNSLRVRPFSGEVQECDADMVIPGRGLDFVWARTYNSRTGRSGASANGWTFSYDVNIQPLGGDIVIHDGTGRVDTFKLQANGTYTCPEFFREGTLNNNIFTLTFADTGRWVFNPFDGTTAAGKLAQIVDRNGNTISLAYDAGGRLAQVVDDLGRTNTVGYNSAGQLASVTDFSGRAVTYQYYQGLKGENGGAGDLKSVTSPPVTGTPDGNDFPDGKTTTYTYSKSFPVDRENHLLLTVTDPKGQAAAVFTYEHNPADPNYLRCIAVEKGANPVERITILPQIATPVNHFAVGRCVLNDPVGNVTESFFDARNRCVMERDYTGRAVPGLAVTDTDNRPTGKLRSTDPDYYECRADWNSDSLCRRLYLFGGQQVGCVYESDFDNSTPARKRADLRVVHELACCDGADTDGDGVADTTELTTTFQYDPRFGTSEGVGMKQYNPTKEYLIGDTVVCNGRGWEKVDNSDAPVGACKALADTIGTFDPTKWQQLAALGNMRQRINELENSLKNIGLLASASGRSKRFGIGDTSPENPLGRFGRPAINTALTGRDCGGFVTSVTDPRGNVTKTGYDAHGNLKSCNVPMPVITIDPSVNLDFTCNTYGQLTAITNAADASGRRRVDTFSYYSSGPQAGYLQSIAIDEPGVQLASAFEYDAHGNMTRAVDPRGNDTLYTYNALDQCVRAQSPTNLTARCVTDYVYDANDNLVQCLVDVRDDTDTKLSTRITSFDYNQQDRLIRVTEPISGTSSAVTEFAYDANDQLTEIHSPLAVIGLDSHNIQAFTYDERGLLFRCTAAPGTGLCGTNEYSYDANYNPATKKYVDDQDTLKADFTYDGFGRLVSVTDPMGNVAACAHDRNGNLVYSRVEAESVDVPGGAGNHRYSECRWKFDALDRCVQSHDAFFDPATQSPVGNGVAVSTCAYAPNGECVSVTDSLGRTTSFAYDTACRLSSVTDARGDLTVSVRDQFGNVTSVTRTEVSDLGGSPQVFSCSCTYDSWNRCISSSDNAGNTSSCAYDSLDRAVRTTDASGNDTIYAYDLLGNCLATTAYAGSSSVQPADIVRTGSAIYDGNSRRLADTDANGNTTSYAYDSLDRLTTTTNADGTTLKLIWSPRSNLAGEEDANGTTITNTYDFCGRIIHRDIAARGPAVASTTFETFVYDGCSQLVMASNDVSRLDFSYDSLGNPTGGAQDGLAQSATHDSEGNLLSLTYPGGRVVTCSYDALNQVTNISTSGGGVSHPQLAQFAYAGPGRLARIGRDNGIKTQIDWDGLANPANGAGDYGWQEVSRVRDGTAASPSLVCDVTGTYSRTQSKLTRADAGRSSLALTYDALEQLVESSDSVLPRDTVYALDAAGNRSHVITNGTTMLPDYAMSSALPPGDFFMNRYTTTPFGSQQYDANGNLIVRASAASPTFYHYDYADRLVEVDGLSSQGFIGPVATFTYDALGDRISKTTYPTAPLAPVTVQYVHKREQCDDGNNVIEERVVASVSRAYCDMTAFTGTGAAQYYHCDDLGNVLALTDAGGNVLERYAYDDYGQPQFLTADGMPLVDSTGQPVTASPLGNPYLFHGMEWDGETGLLNDRGNCFDPQTGRAICGKVKIVRDTGNGGGVFAIEPRDILKTYFETGDVPTQDQFYRSVLKSYFEKGDKPTSSQFATLIDSMVNRLDDRNLFGLRVSGLGGNNPWSGGGGEMQKGTVKFFNETKGFGMVVGGGSKTHTKTGHVTLMK